MNTTHPPFLRSGRAFLALFAFAAASLGSSTSAHAQGSGLAAAYFNNVTLTGTAALTRTEAIDFGWGTSAPASGVNSDNFSVRWTGQLQAPSTGSYTFQTVSDDGIRVTFNGSQIINNWTDHATTTDSSSPIQLTAGTRYDITVEYYERAGGAVARLRWITPGSSSAVAVPASNLHSSAAATQAPYGGSRRAVPGRIQAEDFDTGGQDVAYSDFDSSNNGAQYRPTEGVDIENTTDTGGGVNVGWANAAEWLEYSVNVATAGAHTLRVRAARQPTGNGTLRLLAGSGTSLTDRTGAISIPSTAGWQTWQTITVSGVNLDAGAQTLRLQLDTSGLNINWFELEGPASSTTGTSTTGTSTTGGSSTGGTSTTGGGSGLRGEYFANVSLTGSAALTRTDATVDFNWGTASPGTGIGADNFSVRWTGQIEAPTSGSYTLQTESDDGVRLWLNDVQVINNWTDHAATVNNSSAITLTAGTRYSVRMEFYERSNGAVARLRWITPGATAAVAIPQARLFPASSSGTTSGSTTGSSTGSATGSSTGSAPAVDRVRFFPRSGQAARMLNSRFTGSNSGETTDFVELARITTTPADGQWTELTFNNSVPYRWVKYESPDGGWGNVAEIEFFDGSVKLSGTAFGTSGSRNNSGNTFDKALDGNTSTFFDAATESDSYVGLNLGTTANTAATPTFSPAPGSFSSSVSVTLSTATSGATIRYTTDGSNPTASSGTVYSGAFSLSASSTTVKAIAVKSGLFSSTLAQGTYNVGSTTPVSGGQTTYHIGNSLTDTVNNWLDPIADSAGYNHTFYRSTIPGAPTDWLWTHPGDALGEADYRVVFNTKGPIGHLFQQPFAGHARTIDNEADYGGRFYNLCREKSPNVQHWLYVQWPGSQNFNDDWSLARGSAAGLGLTPATTWAQGVNNHLAFIERIRQRMDDLYTGKSILIVPGGPGLARLKVEVDAGRVPGITDFFGQHFSDNLHLSGKGAYLVSLVHFSCIYRRSPEGIVTSANTGLTAAQAAIYQRVAWDTVRNYQWSGVTGQ